VIESKVMTRQFVPGFCLWSDSDRWGDGEGCATTPRTGAIFINEFTFMCELNVIQIRQ
jgi:hypothetical protein